jgi:hypothetical protein
MGVFVSSISVFESTTKFLLILVHGAMAFPFSKYFGKVIERFIQKAKR